MSKVNIAFAEKRLIEHLRLGGTLDDLVGGELLQRVMSAAGGDADVRMVIESHRCNFEEIRQLYAGIIRGLMPNPCIQAGVIMLTPTLLLLEPIRLNALLAYVEDDAPVGSPQRPGLLLAHGLKIAKHIQDSHAKAYGPAPFTVLSEGGLSRSRRGCAASIGLVAVAALGLLVWGVRRVASV
jgi:hypothetical protein